MGETIDKTLKAFEPNDEQPALVGAGSTIDDRYHLEECISQGATGRVYRATHTTIKKRVAVKILHPEVKSQPVMVERFLREAQAAAQIEHPNICASLDFGETDDVVYMVMEYLDGITLRELIEEQAPLDINEALQIVSQICDGLAQAHASGVIHRDLKPENIMLIEQGDSQVVKVLDFGLARVHLQDGEIIDHQQEEEADRLTRIGELFGTPDYMAPEQVQGLEVDLRTDLYSLGIILYEMLAGRPPFVSDKMLTLMTMQAVEPAPPFYETAPEVDVPAYIERVVLQLLEKEPDARFGSATELREALVGKVKRTAGNPPTKRQQAAARKHQDASLLDQVVAFKDETPQPATPAHRAAAASARSPTNQASRSAEIHHQASRAADGVFETLDRLQPAHRRLLAAAVIVCALFGALIFGLILSSLTDDDDPDKNAAVATSQETTANEDEEPDEPESKKPKTLAGKREAFRKQPVIAEALEPMIRGDAASASKKLEKLGPKFKDNAFYHFFLGASLSPQEDKDQQTLRAYARAIELEPGLGDDEALIKDVVKACGERPGDGYDAMVETLKASKDKEEGEKLEALVRKIGDEAIDGGRRDRRRAYRLLKKADRLDDLPEWQQLVIDLRRYSKCESQKRIVRKLGKTNEPRALPFLDEIHKKPKKGCGFLKSQDCYGCLRGALARARRDLKKAAEDK